MRRDAIPAEVALAAAAIGAPVEALRAEADNSAYGAATWFVDGGVTRFRRARITPTYAGLFVAHWRRGSDGGTEPFADTDQVRLVVAAREGEHFGVFDFSAATLIELGVVSVGGRGGKRGFRLYPPWSVAANERTQRDQCAHFRHLPNANSS